MAQSFDLGAIHVAAKNQALPVRFAVGVHCIAGFVHNQFFTVSAFQLPSAVTNIEIQFAVRPEHKRVRTVVVIHAANAAEQHRRWAVGLVVAVLVGEEQNLGRAGNDHLRAEHGDAQRGIHVVPLIKCLGRVGPAVAIRVLEDSDTVAFRLDFAPRLEQSVIDTLGHPHAALGVDVHIGRVQQHWLGGKQRGLQLRVGDEQLSLLGGGGRAVALGGKVHCQRQGCDGGQGGFYPVKFHLQNRCYGVRCE